MDLLIDKAKFIHLQKGELGEQLLTNADTPPTELAAALRHGPSICCLISGYRGSGKTSFVHCLKNTIGNDPNAKTIFVQVDFSRYQDKTNLFRWLIRKLYLSLESHPAYKALQKSEAQQSPKERISALLETLHEKTFYDSGRTFIQTQETTWTTSVVLDWLPFISWLALSGVVFFSLIAIYPFITMPLAIPLFTLAGGVAALLKKAVSLKTTQENKHHKQEDFTRKTLFDNEIADHFFLSLIEDFTKAGLNLIFVFDEMDKVDETMLDKLATDIKPYMLSGHAKFIVVSGQKLFFRYKRANTEDDAVLASIFSKSVHISLLSRRGFHDLFKSLQVQPAETPQTAPAQASAFVDYLILQSKRIPRKFLHLIQERIQWLSDGKATLRIPDDETPFSLYTRFLDIIDSIEKDEIAPEPLHLAEKDFFIMTLLLACTIILDNRNRTYSAEELLSPGPDSKDSDNNSATPYFNRRMRWFQLRYLNSLLARLKSENILPSDDDQPPVTSNSPSIEFQSLPLDPQQIDTHRLFEFQNLVNRVSADLGLVDSQALGNMSFTQILRRLGRDNALEVSFIDNPAIASTLDKLGELNRDNDGQDLIRKTLSNNQIPVSHLTNQLMEFYGKKTAERHFEPMGYLPIPDTDSEKYDYRLHSADRYFKQLLFEFVVRRGDPLSDRQFFWDQLVRFRTFSEQYFFFFVVFTELNAAAREAARQRFFDWLIEDRDMTHLADRIHFLPINLNELPSLRDGFNSFSSKYISRQWDYLFTQQPAPYKFRERNDHELEEFIEFWEYDITIRITPANSDFWRFAFRFLKDKKLPPRNQRRHDNPQIADVIIGAGVDFREPDGHQKWNFPGKFGIITYNTETVTSDRVSVEGYNASPVTLTIIPEKNRKFVTAQIQSSSFSTMEHRFDLQDYRYCILSAWCDDQNFNLHTRITLDRKVD